MTVLPERKLQEIGSGRWTADQFLAFYMTRPDEERWQLVDGLAMMMVPATRIHQKLGKNLLYRLDRALERHRSDLEAFYELGLRIPGIDDFSPEPDLIVIRADASFDRYADQFFLVAEIISPSNTAEMIERKIELYQSHPDNLYCLTIDQDSVHVTLWSREDGWARTDLRSLDDVLKLPAFGFEAKLADIYAGTPLGR
jgi:Uma2 family endonuclease